jgi:thioredoxin 1
MSISLKLVGLMILFCAVGGAVGAADTQPVQTVKDAYPNLATDALLYARLKDLPPDVLLESGAFTIIPDDLNGRIKQAPKGLWPQMKRNLFFVLEDVAAQALLTYEAIEWAKKNNQAPAADKDPVPAYLASMTANLTVSDEEAKAFFDKNTEMAAGATFDKAKDDLKKFLLDQKRADAVRAHITGIGQRYEVDINKAWVAKQYAAAMDNPVDRTRTLGKPTLVEFGDDSSKPCQAMIPVLNAVKNDYAGRAYVVIVHVDKDQLLGARYDVEAIPVQVFFDKYGKEVFRHVGFYSKELTVAKLTEMGVK